MAALRYHDHPVAIAPTAMPATITMILSSIRTVVAAVVGGHATVLT
jgi:hypothetical protein